MAIVRVRPTPGGFDQYGDPISGTEARLALDGAFVAPAASNDITGSGRQGVIVGLDMFCPFDTDIVATDRVEVDGVLYDIEGDVGRWLHPITGWEAGTQTALRRAAG